MHTSTKSSGAVFQLCFVVIKVFALVETSLFHCHVVSRQEGVKCILDKQEDCEKDREVRV